MRRTFHFGAQDSIQRPLFGGFNRRTWSCWSCCCFFFFFFLLRLSVTAAMEDTKNSSHGEPIQLKHPLYATANHRKNTSVWAFLPSIKRRENIQVKCTIFVITNAYPPSDMWRLSAHPDGGRRTSAHSPLPRAGCAFITPPTISAWDTNDAFRNNPGNTSITLLILTLHGNLLGIEKKKKPRS